MLLLAPVQYRLPMPPTFVVVHTEMQEDENKGPAGQRLESCGFGFASRASIVR
jgi:hypothetical protein